MNEGFSENPAEKPQKSEESLRFDSLDEKERNKEARRILVEKMTETLEGFGFEKTGYSLWSREVNDGYQMVYLFRSRMGGQEYEIELGTSKKEDVPEGENPRIDHTTPMTRIDGVMRRAEPDFEGEDEDEVDKRYYKKRKIFRDALIFTIPDEDAPVPPAKREENYTPPLVHLEDIEAKTEKIQSVIEEYLPVWLASFSEDEA